jgi:hypothetical protein
MPIGGLMLARWLCSALFVKMDNQKLMEKIEELQSALARGKCKVNVPCGADPIIELLGGLHARAAIQESRPGRFPDVCREFAELEKLIKMLQ